MKSVYLDNAATTRVAPEVLDAMLPYLKEEYGNASCLYPLGINASKAVEKAREQVAKLFNADLDEIFFTSGGTESDNMAIRRCNYAPCYRNFILTSCIEHPAVLNSCKQIEEEIWTPYVLPVQVGYIPVNGDGFVSSSIVENLIKTIRPQRIRLLSVMYANNEIGTIQPIRMIGRICRENNIIFHMDAVQAAGHIPIDVKEDRIDVLSCSAHKFNGPKGVGAIYIRRDIQRYYDPFIYGGHQERDYRAGTENVPGIVGLGAAAELHMKNMDKNMSYVKDLRDQIYSQIWDIPNVSINGSSNNRLPNNLNVRFAGINADVIQMMLADMGISVSVGSACHSHTPEPSHVLKAIGLSDEEAHECIRISVSEYNTVEEIDYFISCLKEVISSLAELA